MMTEDEARTKWCPLTHARIMVMMSEGSTFPSEQEILGRYNCIASSCMMWRERGYCGLAGFPSNITGLARDDKVVKLSATEYGDKK